MCISLGTVFSTTHPTDPCEFSVIFRLSCTHGWFNICEDSCKKLPPGVAHGGFGGLPWIIVLLYKPASFPSLDRVRLNDLIC